MKIILSISLLFFSQMALSQTTQAPDPMTQIMAELKKINTRIDALENKSPSSQSQKGTVAAPTPTPAKDELVPGALALIKLIGDDKYFEPSDHFAGFVWTNSTYTSAEIRKSALGSEAKYGLTIQGFLKIETAGRYSLGMQTQAVKDSFKSTCNTKVSINGSVLEEQETGGTNMITIGSAELEKGIYEASIWSVCSESHGVQDVSRKILFKAPTDLTIRQISNTELFHKK